MLMPGHMFISAPLGGQVIIHGLWNMCDSFLVCLFLWECMRATLEQVCVCGVSVCAICKKEEAGNQEDSQIGGRGFMTVL